MPLSTSQVQLSTSGAVTPGVSQVQPSTSTGATYGTSQIQYTTSTVTEMTSVSAQFTGIAAHQTAAIEKVVVAAAVLWLLDEF